MTEHHPEDEAELIEFVRAIDVPAPSSLHEKVDGIIDARTRGAARRPRPLPSAFAGLAVAAVVVLALALAGTFSGNSRSLLKDAARSTVAPATLPAPAQSVSNPSELTVAQDGVTFPYWGDVVGWRASGARHDLVDGRASTTVFYVSPHGQSVGYTIVGGAPTPNLSTGRRVWRAGTAYHLANLDGLHVVAWLRSGHACVLAGARTSYATLVQLASTTV